MDKEQINNLADKIAQLVSADSKAGEFASLQKSIDSINERLRRLELPPQSPASAISTAPSQHPSQDRFAVAEAIVDSLFGRSSNEKTCTFEPDDRPCDHCSMCSSRGF